MAPFSLAGGHLLPAFVASLLISGCTSYELVQPPTREADVFPHAELQDGIAIAVDEIGEPQRARRYFGADLKEKGILPVQVIVSNRSDDRVEVRPSDVLLHRGREVLDPLPLEHVLAIPKRRGLFVTDATEDQLNAFYESISFRETVLAPGETYQGVFFFDRPERRERGTRFFRLVSLYREPSLRLRVVATNLETRERIGFGPFGISD